MRLFQSFCIAFSMYSRIPMPRVDWKEENMKYSMCFFPLVGAAVGGIMLLFTALAARLKIDRWFVSAVCTFLPIWVSGGIHMDGFMDTLDARASYGEKERKLEILKDSHTGAFAVIGCGMYFLMSYGAWMSLKSRMLPLIACGYALTRALSALSVVTFPLAKNSGFVTMFSNASHKRAVRAVMAVYIAAVSILMAVIGQTAGILLTGAVLLVYLYYYKMSKAQFGGITGDLAGYFVQSAELVLLCAAVIAGGIL